MKREILLRILLGVLLMVLGNMDSIIPSHIGIIISFIGGFILGWNLWTLIILKMENK